jgi:hypothetical protein
MQVDELEVFKLAHERYELAETEIRIAEGEQEQGSRRPGSVTANPTSAFR